MRCVIDTGDTFRSYDLVVMSHARCLCATPGNCDQSTSDELVVGVDRCIPIYRFFFLQFSGRIMKPGKSRIDRGLCPPCAPPAYGTGSKLPVNPLPTALKVCLRAYCTNVYPCVIFNRVRRTRRRLGRSPFISSFRRRGALGGAAPQKIEMFNAI